MTVRTRFAPSPTGYLHIGGVRTALFNWLFARQHGGQFLLRIDDTDAGRNVQAALAPILGGLKWLGIDWDEGPDAGGPYGPYYQSQRGERYRAAVEKLLASGAAYYDYARTEELQAERDAAQKAGRAFVYSRRFMAHSEADCARFESEGRQRVVRIKTPHEGTLALDDLVRGRVEFAWANEQDHVIQRPDSSCLYHLASVVDDYDFKITHVIRAEEHLSNTPRQVFIIDALGYPRPQYAHLPYVAAPGSREKLSKRKIGAYLKNPDFKKVYDHGRRVFEAAGGTIGSTRSDMNLSIGESLTIPDYSETFNPVIVDFYREVGYLPEAIVNYLLLLGWSLDDKTEIFSRLEMIQHFSLERVNKAPASLDTQKLVSFQQRYMNALPVKQRAALVLPFLQKAGIVSSPPPCDVGPRLAAVVTAAGDRLTVAGDILDYQEFFQGDDAFKYDEAAWDKRIRNVPDAPSLLTKFRDRLAAVEPFEPAALEAALNEFVAAEGIKIGQIVHPLRVALTGKSVGFGLFDTLAILGRSSCNRRIERALARLA